MSAIPTVPSEPGLPGRRQRWAAVAGLLVLSPICAEYLVGYDSSIGRPLDLLAGLLILGPLYGTVAVLVREIARRAGRGWPTILVLGAAAGVVQAGLIDQSLFTHDFGPSDPDWATQAPVTVIPGIGVDAAALLVYVVGHVVWSFAAPIAIVEACAPGLARRRWLGRGGIVTMVVLWVVAAALVHSDAAAGSTASPGQLVGAAVVATALAVAALRTTVRRGPPPGRPPAWWWVGVGTAIALAASQLLPETWGGVAVHAALLVLLGCLLLRWSRRPQWSASHVLAVAGAALLVRSVIAFLVEPLGEVDIGMKYVSNTVILVGVVALLAMASRRSSRATATLR